VTAKREPETRRAYCQFLRSLSWPCISALLAKAT